MKKIALLLWGIVSALHAQIYQYEKQFDDPVDERADRYVMTNTYYSILNESGDTIQAEKPVTCNDDEIASMCTNGRPEIRTTKLPEGNYTFAIRFTLNGKEENMGIKFSSAGDNGTLDLQTLMKTANVFDIKSFGSQIQISSTNPQPFVIFNSKGQMVKNGRVNGSANIMMISAGNYWVKVGSQTRQVRVFN